MNTAYLSLLLEMTKLETLYRELSKAIRVDDAAHFAWSLTKAKFKNRNEIAETVEPQCLDHHYPSMLHENSVDADRELAACILTDTQYRDDQDPRATVKSCGAIACSEQTLKLAHAINELKKNIQKEYKNLKWRERAKLRKPDFISELLKQAQESDSLDPAVESFAEKIPRTHFVQVERLIGIVEEPLISIGFSVAAINRSIVKISAKDAEKLLRDLGEDSDHIDIQLKALATIKNTPTEKRLRLVREHSSTNVANLKIDNGKESAIRQAKKCSMPLLYCVKKTPEPLKIGFSSPSEKIRKAAHRSDKRLEDLPFLPSINAYLVSE